MGPSEMAGLLGLAGLAGLANDGMVGSSDGRPSRKPVTVADFQPYLGYFDGRSFPVGSVVKVREDGKAWREGGLINYAFPLPGEPALVVGHCEPSPTSRDTSYENETMVILTFTLKGNVTRYAVDPVHFERYELPGERMLREIGEEDSSK